ncbi:MAG: DNA alkylation repair protein [Bacilli bacterium]|nr:DNA alkylation repair protein [Bacilli bacterium]
MNFEGSWNKEKYQEFLNYLITLEDLKYKDFHKKIITSDNLIGIRTNELKKIAKEINNNNYQEFIKLNDSNLYEPIMIEGFIYSYLKIPFDELTNYLNEYLKKINNWAHVDLLVSNLKIFNKNQEQGFKYAKKLIHSKNHWIKRCGIIIMLNYYLHDIYIDKTLEIISKIKTDDYYVKMAIAWLMSISYIKYKEKTLIYLVNIEDNFIYNKTLSKIVDSKRISEEEKKFIKSLKRSKKEKIGV